MKSEIRNSLVLLHITVFIFGFTGILGTVIDLPPEVIVFWRVLIAFVSLSIYMVWNPAAPIEKRHRSQLILTGLLVSAHWYFFFLALKVSTVSLTLTCLASASLFVAFLEPLIFKRKIYLHEIFVGLIVIAGLAIIFGFETAHRDGFFYAIISAVLAALFGTINGKWVQQYSPRVITRYEMMGAILGSATMIYITDPQLFGIEKVASIDWLWLIVLGTVCTAFAFVASVRVMKKLSPFTVTVAINLEPIYGIIFSLLIFGQAEFMSGGFYIGALLILGAIFINGIIKARKKRKQHVTPV